MGHITNWIESTAINSRVLNNNPVSAEERNQDRKIAEEFNSKAASTLYKTASFLPQAFLGIKDNKLVVKTCISGLARKDIFSNKNLSDTKTSIIHQLKAGCEHSKISDEIGVTLIKTISKTDNGKILKSKDNLKKQQADLSVKSSTLLKEQNIKEAKLSNILSIKPYVNDKDNINFTMLILNNTYFSGDVPPIKNGKYSFPVHHFSNEVLTFERIDNKIIAKRQVPFKEDSYLNIAHRISNENIDVFIEKDNEANPPESNLYFMKTLCEADDTASLRDQIDNFINETNDAEDYHKILFKYLCTFILFGVFIQWAYSVYSDKDISLE